MRVAEAVSRLLAHYWTAVDSEISRKLQIEDWLDDLAGFPVAEIVWACTEWRRANIRRPTPADILALLQPDAAEPERVYHTITAKEVEEKANNRRRVAPLWGLVARALRGEDVDKLLAERRRLIPDDA